MFWIINATFPNRQLPMLCMFCFVCLFVFSSSVSRKLFHCFLGFWKSHFLSLSQQKMEIWNQHLSILVSGLNAIMIKANNSVKTFDFFLLSKLISTLIIFFYWIQFSKASYIFSCKSSNNVAWVLHSTAAFCRTGKGWWTLNDWH